jgi:membrane protein YdbS with pleckstrin-like domain
MTDFNPPVVGDDPIPGGFPRPGTRPTMPVGTPIAWRDREQRMPWDYFPQELIRNVQPLPRWLRKRPPRLFATPDQLLLSVLAHDERIVYGQTTSFTAYVVESIIPPLAALLLMAVLVIVLFANGNFILLGLIFLATGIAWSIQMARWMLRIRYTRYVLTTMRVIRLRGLFNRENAWIPLSKVTDVRYRSTPLGRLFGYAEVRIDSANEESGLKNMGRLADPETFYELLVRLVELKQGTVNLDQGILQPQEPPAWPHGPAGAAVPPAPPAPLPAPLPPLLNPDDGTND